MSITMGVINDGFLLDRLCRDGEGDMDVTLSRIGITISRLRSCQGC